MIFTYPYTIGLHDTDAAAMIFAPNLIRMCHQAHEAFMESIGYGLGRLFKERPFGLPVVHIEGDYRKIMRIGDKVEIRMRIAEITEKSLRTAYELVRDGEVMATAAIVYVCVDTKTYKSRELPDDFRKILEQYAN